MGLALQITPVGDTSAREISAAWQDVCEVQERVLDIARIELRRIPASGQDKGVADVLDNLFMPVSPLS